MSLTRTTGLLLLLVGALTFLSTTNHMIPAVAFFPGLAVSALGVLVLGMAGRTPRANPGQTEPASPATRTTQATQATEIEQTPGEDLSSGPIAAVLSSFDQVEEGDSPAANQLAKLRRLADDGIISEEEFAVAKAKILT